MIDDVLVFRWYSNVFPNEFLGVPLKRHVKFHIDLVLRETMTTKTPYKLAPPEIKELSTQMHELLNKGFIQQSSSP